MSNFYELCLKLLKFSEQQQKKIQFSTIFRLQNRCERQHTRYCKSDRKFYDA